MHFFCHSGHGHRKDQQRKLDVHPSGGCQLDIEVIGVDEIDKAIKTVLLAIGIDDTNTNKFIVEALKKMEAHIKGEAKRFETLILAKGDSDKAQCLKAITTLSSKGIWLTGKHLDELINKNGSDEFVKAIVILKEFIYPNNKIALNDQSFSHLVNKNFFVILLIKLEEAKILNHENLIKLTVLAATKNDSMVDISSLLANFQQETFAGFLKKHMDDKRHADPTPGF